MVKAIIKKITQIINLYIRFLFIYLHNYVYIYSKGLIGKTIFGRPCLILFTQGAKTGVERKNVLAIARTLGLKVPGLRPSVTLVDFSVTVPVFGDTWDIRYAPNIRYGSQGAGGGQIFENLEDIDFSSPYTFGGVPTLCNDTLIRSICG